MSGLTLAAAQSWVRTSLQPVVLLTREKSLFDHNDSAILIINDLSHPTLQENLAKVEQSGQSSIQTIGLTSERGSTFYDLTISALEDGFIIQAKDSSLEHNLRAALMDSRQRFKDLVEISSDFAWEVGPEGEFVFVSQRGAIGFEPDELINKRSDDIVLKRDSKMSLNPFMSKMKLEREEVWVIRADGEPACLMISCLPLFSDQNIWIGARGVCRDITDERERDAALARAYHRDQLLAYIVKTIRDEVEPVNMLSAAATATARALSGNGCQIYRKKAETSLIVDAIFGDVPDDVPDLFDRLDQLAENEVGIYESHGCIALYAATRYRRVINGAICLWREKVRGYWNDDDKILAIDVANQLGIANEQISGHERIVELSRTDALTGLLNRRAFFDEELPRRMERLEFQKQNAALIYVDLDHFKQVNDIFGHQRGDEILRLIRDFLLKHVRPGDVIARLGGDEFALWLDNIDLETAKKRCNWIISDSTFLKEHSGQPDKPLGVSVGLALYNSQSKEDIEHLINRADAAMYDAKRKGKGKFCLAAPFEPTDATPAS